MKLLLTPLRLALLLFCLTTTLQSSFADNNKYRIYAQVGETKYYMTGEPTNGRVSSTTDASMACVYEITAKSVQNNEYYITYKSGENTYFLCWSKNGNSYDIARSTTSYYFTRYKGNNGKYQFCISTDKSYSLMYYALSSGNFQFQHYSQTQNGSSTYYDLNIEEVVDTPTPQSFDLTVSSAGYATLCLPFNADVPSGVELYAGSYANGRVTLVQPQSGKVHSGEGYIVRATPGTYTFSPISELFNKPEGNSLVGVTERTDLDGTDGRTYIFKQQDGVVGFYRLTNTGYIGANKAYLKIDAPLDSRSSSRLGLE